MPTAYEIDKEEWRNYRPSNGSGWLKQDPDGAKRRNEALELATRASELLKKEFGATRVVVFGSIAHDGWFTPWSDIDLAAWDIKPELFYSAVDAVTGLSPSFRIDLVDVNDCKPSIKEAIEREGMEI